MNKKGITPVIAMAMFVLISLVSVISFQTWFTTFESSVLSNTEIQSQDSTVSTNVEDLIGTSLYFNNNKNTNLSISKVKINSNDCTINKDTFISGISQVDLSSCMRNLSTSNVEVVVVTNDGIFSKEVYIDVENLIVNGPIYTDTFISVWKTDNFGDSNDTTISLPLESEGIYNFQVDWGDGNSETITSYNQNNHSYSSSGTYTVNITGTIKGFNFASAGDEYKIIEIQSWGSLNLGNNGDYFAGCSNLEYTGNDDLNLLGTYDLSSMFLGANNFNGDISNWDVSQVTDMSSMFFNINPFFNEDISQWDVSNVKNMGYMFYDANNFNQDISQWDVSQVTDMKNMFYWALDFNQDISRWDVSQVTDMSKMFYNANNFNQDLSSWDVKNVLLMTSMFDGADIFDQNLGDWNISSVNFLFDFNGYRGMENIFTNSGMSVKNYSATLIGWNSLPSLNNDVVLSAGTVKYNSSANVSRQNLIDTYNWTITDGGLE